MGLIIGKSVGSFSDYFPLSPRDTQLFLSEDHNRCSGGDEQASYEGGGG